MDGTRIPDRLRANVWHQRLETDRLNRYYGRLASIHARRTSAIMALGCAIAFAGPYLDVLGAPTWLWLKAIVSVGGVVIAIWTIMYGHNRIIRALHRQQQLADLYTQWDELWQRVEDDVASRSEVQASWGELCQRANIITAGSAQEKPHKRLLAATQKEAYDYYRHEAAGASA